MNYELLHGDCLEVLKTLPDNSVDSIVTDPPYLLGFMGKAWDAADGIAGKPDVWREALRVLKPGGHLLSFGGTRTYHRIATAIEDAGFEIRDQIQWLYGSGFPKSHNLPGGFGTALKPANEPICMARKPFPGTVADNAQKWGTGALNVDGCRVGSESTKRTAGVSPSARTAYGAFAADFGAGRVVFGSDSGRWPANLIHDGSEEVMEQFPTTRPSRSGKPRTCSADAKGVTTFSATKPTGTEYHDNGGTAARFFYCAKASKSDRGEGNDHPTVKPTALMRYLCRLITPPGGTVLDPFAGSGSTGKGALLEGFYFIGIEREAEYIEIAHKRLEAVQPTLELA